MTTEQAKLILSKNLEAFKRGSGYTDDVVEAIQVMHLFWFKTSVPSACKECVISALNRVFNQYINLYDTPTT